MRGLPFPGWQRWAAGILLACLLPGWAQAAIAFRAASSASVAEASTVTYGGHGSFASRGNCGSISPSLPSGTAAGNLLIAVVVSGASPTLSMPGWTLLFQNNPVSNLTSAIYWRIATGGDPNTITQSGTCNVLAARISRFTGVDTMQPFMTAPLAASNWSYQNADTVTTGTETTDYPGAMLVVTAHTTDDSDFGPLLGFAQAYSSRTGTGNDAAIALYYAAQAAPGTAGPYTVTKTRGADPNHGTVFALRPMGLKLTIPVPAGTQANDVMIASIALQPCSATIGGACVTSVNPPAGWTLVRTIDQTTGTIPFSNPLVYGNRLFVYRRIASGAEPASYTWTLGGALKPTGAVGGITSFSGVDTTNPIVAEAGQATPSSTSHTAPSIDTGTVTDTMLVSTHAANASTLWNPPLGMTERVDGASQPPPNVTGISMEMNTEPRAAAGPTGPRTASFASLLPAASGATHMLALRPAIALHHYAVSALNTSVATCDYAEVTIRGHDAAHAPVSPPAGRVLALSTSTGTGVWQPTLVSGSGTWSPSGVNNGAATYVWPGGEASFTVRLRHATVATLSVNLLDNAGVTESGTEDPAIAFVESAFRISNGANAPLAIGTQIAGKPSNVGVGAQALYLQAIRTDTETGACVSLFPSGSEVAVEVGAVCVNPATCTQPVTLSTAASTGNSASFVPNGGYPATINFRFTTANAEAPFSFSYADAGQIRLQFRRALPPPPSGVYIQGTSNAFVTRPFGLAFRGANAATSIQHGTSPASPVLAAAGDPFVMTVAAYRWAAAEDDGTGRPLPGADITDNGLTPNFAADVVVSVSANLPGMALGAVARGAGCSATATAPAAAWSGGAATLSDWCYTEVGNPFFAATVSDYLVAGLQVTGNSGLDGSGPTGGYVGRFRPKYFTVTNASLTNRIAAGCSVASNFTYMNEAMETGLKLSAKNAAGAVTQNYATASGYAKLDPVGSPASLGFGARDGAVNLTPRLDLGSVSGSFVAGEATVAARVALRRANPDNPDGPFEAFELGIAPQDADGVALRPADLNLDVDGVGGNDHAKLGETRIRFGRLRLANAYGSELLDLPVPIRVEHWNGVGFVTNGDDGCTRLAATHVLLSGYQGNLNAGETSVAPAPTISFSAGVGNLKLIKPGAGNAGSVLLRVDLNAEGKTYLRGRWDDGANPDANAGTAYDDDPAARGSFGQYKAGARLIDLRESY
jgi:hypothetical protein